MDEPATSRGLTMCEICQVKESRYCCPKCDLIYCSLACYKAEKHITCSETFYQACVEEDLAAYAPSEESEKLMKDMLKRMYKKDKKSDFDDEFVADMEGVDDVDSDDDDDLDLHKRVFNLNLDDTETLWSALSNDEKNEFQAIINEDDIAAIVPQWTPWWNNVKGVKLINEVDLEGGNNAKEDETLAKCPPHLNVPLLSALTSVNPSDVVKHNFPNVIAAYAFVARYLNGEMDPLESSVYLFEASLVLESDFNFESAQDAIASVKTRCLQSQLIQTDQRSVDLMGIDTLRILQGPSVEKNSYYCISALSHIHSLFSKTKSLVKSPKKDKSDSGDKKEKGEFAKRFPDHKAEDLPKIEITKLRRCMKKIEFFIAFLEDRRLKLLNLSLA